jgi:hypothetical protein
MTAVMFRFSNRNNRSIPEIVWLVSVHYVDNAVKFPDIINGTIKYLGKLESSVTF